MAPTLLRQLHRVDDRPFPALSRSSDPRPLPIPRPPTPLRHPRAPPRRTTPPRRPQGQRARAQTSSHRSPPCSLQEKPSGARADARRSTTISSPSLNSEGDRHSSTTASSSTAPPRCEGGSVTRTAGVLACAACGRLSMPLRFGDITGGAAGSAGLEGGAAGLSRTQGWFGWLQPNSKFLHWQAHAHGNPTNRAAHSEAGSGERKCPWLVGRVWRNGAVAPTAPRFAPAEPAAPRSYRQISVPLGVSPAGFRHGKRNAQYVLKCANMWSAAKVSWLRSATLRQDAVRGGPEAPPYPRPMSAPRDLSRCMPRARVSREVGFPGTAARPARRGRRRAGLTRRLASFRPCVRHPASHSTRVFKCSVLVDDDERLGND